MFGFQLGEQIIIMQPFLNAKLNFFKYTAAGFQTDIVTFDNLILSWQVLQSEKGSTVE